MNPTQKTLLVGCGGSGITTLLRFNELLAGNQEWREVLWESVSYLVIDTEVEKTLGFRDAVNRQLGRAKKPIMRLVQITKGYQQLDDIVGDKIDPRAGTPEGARIRENWWFAPDEGGAPGTAYRAQYIRDIEHGAGQCGLVSYLCAWDYLPKLKEDLSGILQEIQKHNIGEDEPLAKLRVCIVTGMAGGTGRGSWNLVAFKVRQALQELGCDVNPDGIFFDATCFENTPEIKRNPDQKISTKVNSLAAISELAAWMRVRDSGKYRFRLPDLAEPDPKAIGATDVIKVEQSVTDKNKCSPVSSSYLIFGNNGRGSLRDNSQYHEMAAAALYSMVVGARYVDAGKINRLTGFGSLAASSFEVDSVRMRAFFESVLRQAAVEELCRRPDKKPALASEALAMVGAGEESDSDDSFFGRTRLCVDSEMTYSSVTTPDVSPRAMPFVQRAISIVRAQRGAVVENFCKKLDQQNPKAALSDARNALQCEYLDDDAIASVRAELLGISDATDLRAALVDAVMAVYAPPPEKDLAPSIGRALAALDALKAVFVKSSANLDSTISSGKASYSKLADVERVFKGQLDEAAKRGFLELKPFTAAERKTLRDNFEWHVNASIFFKLKPMLKKVFHDAAAEVAAIRASFESLLSVMDAVNRDFRKGSSGVVEGAVATATYEDLFVDPGVVVGNDGKEEGIFREKAVFDAIPRADDTQNVYRRVVKPIMSEDDLKALLLAPGSCVNKSSTVTDSVKEEIQKMLQSGGKGLTEDGKSEMKKRFVSMFKTNISLDADFMKNNFSLKGVLQKNLKWWNRLLAAEAGDPDQFDVVRDRFRVFLGVQDLPRGDDGNPYIAWDGLLKNLVVSLVGTCKPWVKLRDAKGGEYLVTLALIPVDLSSSEVDDYSEAIRSVHSAQETTIVHYGMESEGGHHLPLDRIVVFASQDIKKTASDGSPLDRVSSLDYWSEATIKLRLERAERPEPTRDAPSAYFEWSEDDGQYVECDRGLGFISPKFLLDPVLANLRWKPWAPKETVSVQDANEREVKNALLYALLGNGMPADDPRMAELRDKFNWTLPLLEMGRDKSEDFHFVREPLDWSGTAGKTVAIPAWAQDERLATSIDRVFEYLLGMGRPGEDGRRQEENKADGKRKLAQLAAEAQAFGEHVGPAIGSVNLSTIKEALQTWMKEHWRMASSEDKPYWLKLMQLADAGK